MDQQNYIFDEKSILRIVLCDQRSESMCHVGTVDDVLILFLVAFLFIHWSNVLLLNRSNAIKLFAEICFDAVWTSDTPNGSRSKIIKSQKILSWSEFGFDFYGDANNAMRNKNSKAKKQKCIESCNDSYKWFLFWWPMANNYAFY